MLPLRLYLFSCNADACEKDTGEIAPPNSTDGARSAWRVAKASGWTRHGKQHFCSDHIAPSDDTTARASNAMNR